MLKKRTDVLIADLLKIMSCKIICMHWKKKKEEKEQDNWSFSCLVTAVCFFRSLRSAYIPSLMKEIKGGQGNLIFKLPGHL